MTHNVLMGTLNPTHSFTYDIHIGNIYRTSTDRW